MNSGAISNTSPDGGVARRDGGPSRDGGSVRQKDQEEARPSADAGAPLEARQADPACGLTITDIALYQAVKIPLVRGGVEVRTRDAGVVQQRRALVRVFLKTTSKWSAGKVSGSLTISSRAGEKTLADQRSIAATSTDGELDSTLNFEVPAEKLTDGASYTFALTAPSACAAVRFPAEGTAALNARRVGALRIKLVPIRFTADKSDRLPDTSDEQLARMRARLLAMFPVETVELSLHAPVKSAIALTGEPAGWNDLLDAMRDLRTQEKPDADVFYFGLISPAKSLEAYCPDACYLGLSFRTDVPSATHQVGVGLGFSGDISASVLAHELGHLAGRKHAPCKTTTHLDPAYPQSEGKTGSWGWDERSRTLQAPDATRDLMGYCSPAWISDYTYGAILDRLSKVNGGAREAASLDEVPARWRVLVAGAGRAHWGLSTVDGEAVGVSEDAAVLDESGNVIDTIEVWRSEVGEEGGWSVLVPEPQPGWHGLQLAGAPAVRFDEPSPVPAMEP